MFGVKKIILTAIVFALWGGLIFVLAKNHYCSSEQNKIAKLTKNCKENYDQAQCYLAILNKYDSNYTKFNYGVSLFKAKKYSESIDEFNKIISKPHDENTKYHLCKFDNSAIVDASKQNVTKAQ